MDEIVKDFLIESGENLDRLDQELVKLESEPSSKELLASIFRTIHTIKGSCGFLGFPRLEKITHAGENLLSRLRDEELTLNPEITNGLLAMVDAIRRVLAEIGASGEDGKEDYAALIQELLRLQTQEGQQSPKTPEPVSAQPPALPQNNANNAGKNPELAPIIDLRGSEPPASRVAPESGNPKAATETVRVGVDLLDRLMNLVGELVLARNHLLQFSGTAQDAGFQALSQRMNLIASELQEEVMRTRMQPIGNLWNKFPRTVRDLARDCGKDVRIDMYGKETELDRTIIEAVRDPLTHLVRNAVDHGIEPAEERKQKGKHQTGRVVLRAFHEGGQVNIEISDDGSGLNLDRIRCKAIERGIMSADQSVHMPERDIVNLIFLPGFSTAEKVSKVSGRGVGLDVVKTNIEKIGGTVDVQTIPGNGTTVKIKIPLTLAIIPALMVTSAGERFAIPQVSLLELVRLEAGEAARAIETVHGAPVYRLRGRLLPLVYLNRELELATERVSSAIDETVTNIVVLRADGREFGLVVDDITDTVEIVVKPLGRQLNGISAYSGATIMGDGRVALILDILGLAQRAGVIASDSASDLDQKEEIRKAESDAGQGALLLVECGNHSRMAIPLSLVARLEEFPGTAIEFAGRQEVTQYRGQIMPLIRLSQGSGQASDRSPDLGNTYLPVVVYSEAGRSVGLIVDRIVDIVDERLVVERVEGRRGVLGSAVIQKRVTDLLDVPVVVRDAIPAFAEQPPPS